MKEGPPIPRPDQTTASKIRIDSDILSNDCPYNIDVNPEKFDELLTAFSIPPTLAGYYSLHIQRRDPPPLETGGGYYSPRKKEVNLCLDKVYDYYLVNSIIAAQYINGESQIIPFQRLATNRLPSYLKSRRIPVKRRIAFAEKILTQATQRDIARILTHEVAHAIYDLANIVTLANANQEDEALREAYFTYLESYSDIHRDHDQRIANKVGEDSQFDPRFDNIVTIIPKKTYIQEYRTRFRRERRELDRKYPPTPIIRIA